MSILRFTPTHTPLKCRCLLRTYTKLGVSSYLVPWTWHSNSHRRDTRHWVNELNLSLEYVIELQKYRFKFSHVCIPILNNSIYLKTQDCSISELKLEGKTTLSSLAAPTWELLLCDCWICCSQSLSKICKPNHLKSTRVVKFFSPRCALKLVCLTDLRSRIFPALQLKVEKKGAGLCTKIFGYNWSKS